jgi:hypothetical protein
VPPLARMGSTAGLPRAQCSTCGIDHKPSTGGNLCHQPPIGTVVLGVNPGHGDFASMRVIQPSRYELLADAEVADQAQHMLTKLNGGS